MKFIEDYLTELFGVDVCGVRLSYTAPTGIIATYFVQEAGRVV